MDDRATQIDSSALNLRGDIKELLIRCLIRGHEDFDSKMMQNFYAKLETWRHIGATLRYRVNFKDKSML